MYAFTVNGKQFKYKTLREARYMAQFNEGMTIISKIDGRKKQNDQTNAKTKPLNFYRGNVCPSN
jgi:hypothetical protein